MIMKNRLKTIVSILLFAVCVLSARPAHAGYLHVWSPQELVKVSDVLAVVEVLKPVGAPLVPANATRPQFALSPRVRVRVLRSFVVSRQKASTSSAIADGEEIVFARSTQEIESASVFARGLPLVGAIDFSGVALRDGEIVVVPLEAVADATKDENKWRLAAVGGTGSPVPATRRVANTTAKNAIEFLGLEVAGALMSEQAGERDRAARYLGYAARGGPNITSVAPMDVILGSLEKEIGSNSARWEDVFVSLYFATGTPRPTVADLLSGDRKRMPQFGRAFWNLASSVLKHLASQGLDDRLAAAFVARAPRNSWAASTSLESNYPLHPLTLKFFNDGLEEARPEALERVLYLLDDIKKDRDHPLVPVALRAAQSALNQFKLEPRGLWAASTIIRRFGSEHDVALFVNRFKTAQKNDRARYRLLWLSNQWGRERGFLALHRIAIIDDRFESGGQRFSDEAAFSLQIEMRQNFGWKGTPTLAQRNAIVARARAWLAKNAQIEAATAKKT
jgi:hypothetical protein